MQLKMNEYQLPENVSFNYEELKQGLTEKVQMYKTLVYTDDQISEAKKDKASLNKLKKALNDERIRLEREYMLPFNDFKAKINEIIRIIDEPIGVIDQQVKGYEEQKKTEKLAQIQDYWDRVTSPEHPLTLQRVMNSKWLNATTSMKSIHEEINGILAKYAEDLATLQNLPEFSFEAIEVYKTTLDLGKAIQEGKRLSDIQKRRMAFEAEQERLKAEAEFAKHMNPPEEPEEQLPGQASFTDTESFDKYAQAIVEEKPTEPLKQWISFKALLSTEDALALKAFFESRNIEFESI